MLGVAGVEQILVEGGGERGVRLELRLPADFDHRAGAGQELPDVRADERRRQQAHRGQHREAPAHVRRHGEERKPFLAGDVKQVAFLRVGHGGHLLGGLLRSHFAPQPVVDDEELRHGFGGRARLGDDEHERFARVGELEGAAEDERVDVVEHHELRRDFFLPKGPRAVDGGVERKGAQRRAADAENEHGAVLPPPSAGVALDRFERRFVEGEPREAELALVHARREALDGSAGLRAVGFEVGGGQALAAAHQVGAQVRPVVAKHLGCLHWFLPFGFLGARYARATG